LADNESSPREPRDGRAPDPPSQHSQETDEISLLDILIVLAKHKKLVLGFPFLAAVVAAGITLLMPNWYTATTKILPPQQSQSSSAAMLGQLQLGALAGAAGGSLGIKNPNDTFVAILRSRTIADAIIEQFKLKELYDEKYLQDTRKELGNNVNISSGKDGVITLEVDDKSPQRAADMANAYIKELEKLTLKLAVGEAGQRRLFFEKQLKQAKDDLTLSEIELTKFQKQKGIIDPKGQAGLTISAAAALRAQMTAKEVQLASLRSFATPENPDLLRAQQELAGLRVEMAKISRGGTGEIGDVLVSMGKAPEEGADYFRRFRDMKYYETLYELLAKQYEIAKIDEARDAALIQVLDQAITPERKTKPKRSLIVLLTALVVGFLGVLWAFVKEALDRARHEPEQAQRLSLVRKYLLSR
jgi:uncharacterized protein involved in exopolysaccharide biosynthesis